MTANSEIPRNEASWNHSVLKMQVGMLEQAVNAQIESICLPPPAEMPQGSPRGGRRYSKWRKRGKYWSGQKVYLAFSVRCMGKPKRIFRQTQY